MLGELLRCHPRHRGPPHQPAPHRRLHLFEHGGADQGLRDLLAGHAELHTRGSDLGRTPGHPSGLGSSAARLAAQYNVVLPEPPSAEVTAGYPFVLPRSGLP